jgi:hypothetical protein
VAAQSIRALIKHRPKGLCEVLEYILQTRSDVAVSVAAVKGLVTLIGDEAGPALQGFIDRDPKRNRKIVARAKGQMVGVNMLRSGTTGAISTKS